MLNGSKTSRKKKRNKSQYQPHNNYFCLPHAVLDHPDFLSMSWAAQSLLIHICRFYNGFNNGDISIPRLMMKNRGWPAGTLNKSKKELIDKQWLFQTRQGFKRKCSLFAITFIPIDDSKENKYDVDLRLFEIKKLK